jgi:hypothetical protein
LAPFAENSRPVDDIPLLSEMQRLVLHTSSLLVFGNTDLELGRLIQSYFEQPRSISAAGTLPDLVQRRALIQTGARLDRLLRARMLAFRMDVEKARRCMMCRRNGGSAHCSGQHAIHVEQRADCSVHHVDPVDTLAAASPEARVATGAAQGIRTR